MNPLVVHFLGTGGGRFTMITQRRRTAGIRLIHGETQVHVDPGPGAVVFSNWARLSPQSLDAVVVTHCHPDHYTDAEVLVEAMTHGTKEKRGILAASRSVLYGNEDCDPSISRYHQSLVGAVESLTPGSAFEVENLEFRAVDARHSDVETVGLIWKTPSVGAVGYTSDTGYFPELDKIYRGLRVLVLCTMWPKDNPLRFHLCTDDALKILEGARPGCAVLTHFGMKMFTLGPDAEASFLEKSTDIPTVAAEDGMRLVIDEKIEAIGPRKKEAPRVIEA